MLFIVVLFFLISAIVLGLFLCYAKIFRMSDQRARKIEIFGYILLFIVVAWQGVVKSIMMDQFYNIDLMQIDEKLTYIFLMLKSSMENGTVDTARFSKSFFSLESDGYIQSQLQCVNFIESLLIIASTVFVAIGRLQELLDKKISSESDTK